MAAHRFSSHEEYLATVPASARLRLEQIRAEAEAAVPGAGRCIAYNMPALRLGRVFFYVAAFRSHIGVYPPVTDDAQLLADLEPWRGPRGNLQFRHDRPIPDGLVARIAVALSKEYG